MKKSFRYIWIVAALVVIYLGWTFYSRWSDKQEFMKQMEENNPQRDDSLSDVYTENLSIINFYAIPQEIRAGETAQLCYGVASAETVRIEPAVDNVWPAYTRCVDISPKTDTVYKLIAEDAEGNTATQETEIKVIQK